MTGNQEDGEYVSATVRLSVLGEPIEIGMSVPNGTTRPTRMLPLFQSLTDSFVRMTTQAAAHEGLAVSCKEGCGACCRQMVPISITEARRLREVVDLMPELRRAEVLARFNAALERMKQVGLLDRLLTTQCIAEDEYKPLALNYFHQGVACPFLEDESCSIHADRPLVCREYMVFSPPENCARLNAEHVQVMALPAEVSRAVRGIEARQDLSTATWMPLILALEWTSAEPHESASQIGKEIMVELFSRLTDA